MNGPRFADPPAYTFRRRPLMSLGLLALAGAILALVFLALLVGMLDARFDVHVDDVLRFLFGVI